MVFLDEIKNKFSETHLCKSEGFSIAYAREHKKIVGIFGGKNFSHFLATFLKYIIDIQNIVK